MTRSADLVDLIAAVIRGDRSATQALSHQNADAFATTADAHGVLSLVASALAIRPDAPGPLVAMLKRRVDAHAAADLLQEEELRQLLTACERAGVRLLIMKGAQLAYTHYPRPDVRPRLDTDILIEAAARPPMTLVLEGLGYRLKPYMGGELVMAQQTYEKRRCGVVSHAVDVHWKIANPQVFSRMVAFDELADASVPIPALSATARGLSDPHALLVACVHRVAHHNDVDRLIWLYDIHLLAARLDREGWRQFAALATGRGVSTVCRVSLRRATDRFRTATPAGLWAGDDLDDGVRPEPTAAYLRPRHPLAGIADDLRALPTWASRWRLVREHLFPPAAYMRQVYAPASVAPLPLLYARRVWLGARKWLERP